MNTAVTGGGPLEADLHRHGRRGHAASTGLPAVSEAVETAYPQNPNLSAAFAGAGVQYFGSDASKAYPNPSDRRQHHAGLPGGRDRSPTERPRSIPRYPTNIYYNVSTEAQEVDEFNTLYTPDEPGRKMRGQRDHHVRDDAGNVRRQSSATSTRTCSST